VSASVAAFPTVRRINPGEREALAAFCAQRQGVTVDFAAREDVAAVLAAFAAMLPGTPRVAT
jgi:hypothetical protein